MQLVVIQMTEERLREHLTHAAQLGAHTALRDAGLPIKEYYTRKEMCKRHGRARVNSLISCGKLHPHKYPSLTGNARTVYSETELLSQII